MAKWAIFGDETVAFEPRAAKAFCQGRQDNVYGLVIGANPYTLLRERENFLAWDAGHTDYTNNPADDGFCATPRLTPAVVTPTIPVPDLDGDGLPDEILYGTPNSGELFITEDADSINIDIDGDGTIDLEIHK